MSDPANKDEDRDQTHAQQGDKSEAAKKPESGERDSSERLDEGLEETFPSSDPVSVKITK